MTTSITTYTNNITAQSSTTIEAIIERIKNTQGVYTVTIHNRDFSVCAEGRTGFFGLVSPEDAWALRCFCKGLDINFIWM